MIPQMISAIQKGIDRRITLLVSLIIVFLLASCIPLPFTSQAEVSPSHPFAQFQLIEHPLVEQSKDNPTHPEFQNWVPAGVLAHQSSGMEGKIASVNGMTTDQTGLNINTRLLTHNDLFHAQFLQGKPFFFFQKGGLIRLNFNGQVLPFSYDSILTDNPPDLSLFNPGENDHMIWFYALRDGLWYYVEAGYF